MLELINFFTRIPTGKKDLERAAKYSYLLPLVGILIGVIVGGFSFFVFKFIDKFLATMLTLVCLYLVTGLIHLDGLADFADGIYTSGDTERKIKAMKDVQTGIAGITFVIFVILFLVFIILNLNGNFYKIIVAEVCAKTAMLSVMLFGKPMQTGLGKIFIEKLNKTAVLFSILFSFAVSFILLGYIGILAVISSILISLIMARIAHKNFGAINGDVIGATNELSRVISLLVLLI